MSNPYEAPHARGAARESSFDVLQFVLGVLLGAVTNGVVLGCGLVALAMLERFASSDMMAGFGVLTGFAVLGIGVAQVVWNGPIAVALWWRGRRSMALGVITEMALLFLLNAACWGLLGMAMVGA